MMDIVRSQVIEMIARQALSLHSCGHSIKWADIDPRPIFEEQWFWDNFNDMVDEAVMGITGAVESWVTIEYEQDIIDIIDQMG